MITSSSSPLVTASATPSPRVGVRERHQPRAPLLVAALAPLLFALGGCASYLDVQPTPPQVSVSSVRPLSIGLTRQRLEFRLRVQNPNDFDLPLRSLSFVASLTGEELATGRSDERVTIPAGGEEIVEVEVVTGVGRLFGRLREMLEERTLDLDYSVAGHVRLGNWPTRIPFDVTGVIENPRDELERGEQERGEGSGTGMTE